MTTKIITILLGLTILILGLNYGSPIEIIFQPGHRIGTLILAVLIGMTFYFLLKQSSKIKPQWFKILGLGFTGIVFLPYLWIGIWTVIPAIFSSDYPIFEDISEYSNKKGETVKGQFMRISGSIYAYQNRKIIYDFKNGIRISYLYPDDKINGVWNYHRFESNDEIINKTDTTYTAEFKNGREIK